MPNSNETMQKQLLELSEKFSESLEKQNALLTSQTSIITSLVSSMKESLETTGKTSNQYVSMTENVKRVGEEVIKLGKETLELNSLGRFFEKATGETGKFTRMLHKASTNELPLLAASGATALSGFVTSLKLSGTLLENVVKLGKTVVGVMGHFAAAIVTFPFKMLRGLIHMADSGGSNELAQALEEIRKEFGYLTTTAGGAIVQMSRDMKGQLANTGLSVYRVFGTLAERLKTVMEYVKNMGPAMDVMIHRIGEGGAEAFGAYNKALGHTAEGQKAVANYGMSMGQTINQVNHQIANYSLQLSKAFGLTMKEVARSVSAMMGDVQHFGSLSVKELTQVVVYTRKLGIEVKALAGIMDKFANFDQAAESAARLSQAFGLNIDALQMMKEQDPGRQLDMLRQSFFRAGRSIENMTRQERNYLAQTTGLDDASLKLAFSIRSQGLSYDQVTKKGDLAKRNQLTQAQALEKLAGAIERLVMSGSGDGLGFIDKFFKGMEIGIRRSREFREIMVNLRRTLRATMYAGIETGRAFVQAFPGIKDFFKGIATLFEPRKFRTMLKGVVGAFKQFFNDLAGNRKDSMLGLMENLRRNFFSYFDSRTEAGRKIIEGAKKIFTAISLIANGLMKKTIEGLTKGIEFITDLLTGRKNLNDVITKARSSGGFLGPIFSNLIDGMPALANRLFTALKTLFKTVFVKIKPWLIKYGTAYLISTIGVSLASAAVRGIAGGLLSSLAPRMIKNLFFGPVNREIGNINRATQRNSRATEGLGSSTSVHRQSQLATAATQGAGDVARAADRAPVNRGSILKLVLISAFIGIGMWMLFNRIKDLALFIKQEGITFENMAAASLAMVAAAGVVTSAAFAANIISRVSFRGSPVAMVATMAGLFLIVSAMVYTARSVVNSAKGWSAADVGKAVATMTGMSVVFLAASGVVAIASMIGTAMAATEGLGVVVMLAGLGTISLVVVGMASMAETIMKRINNFHARPGFAEKSRIFVDIVKAIGEFTGSFMSTIAKLALSTAISTMFGPGPQDTLKENLNSLKEIIRIVGQEAVSIMRVINTSMSAGLSPEQLEKGRVIVSTLSALGELMKNMQPPTELLESSWWEQFLNPSSTTDKIRTFGNYVAIVGAQARQTIWLVERELGRIQGMNWSANSLKAAELFSGLLTGVAGFAKAMQVDPDILRQLQQGGGRTDSVMIEALSGYVRSVATGMAQSNIFQGISQILDTVVRDMSNLSASQINKLKAVTPLIRPLLESVVGIASIIDNITRRTATTTTGGTRSAFATAATENLVEPAVANTRIVSRLVESLRDVLPNIIGGLRSLNLTPAEAQNIKLVSGVIGPIMQSLQSFAEAARLFMPSSGEQSTFNVQDAVRNVSGVIHALTQQENRGMTFRGALRELSTMTLPTNIGSQARTLAGVMEHFKQITESMSSMRELGDIAARFQTNVQQHVITSIGSSIRTMVEEVNRTSKELSETGGEIPQINISMRKISNAIGLSGNNELTIRKRDLTITIPINVTIDSRVLHTEMIATSRQEAAAQRPHIITG